MTYSTLIQAEQLVSLLESCPDIQVFDCRFNLANTEAGAHAYHQGHIPGSHYAHLDTNLSSTHIPGKTGRHPLPNRQVFIDWMQSKGVNKESQIIAYDDSQGAMAARLWWLCRWIGHEACAVLDGGIQAWQKVASLTAEPPRTQIGNITLRPALLDYITTEDVVSNSTYLLVDARDEERYRGEVEPIDPVAGHIPGAICITFTQNIDTSGHFLDSKNLARRFQALTEDPKKKPPVMYCGSGVTAAHNILAMVHAGLDAPLLYADSWSGWICDPENPVSRH